ncbi:MAG: hypothetical protein ABIU54_00835 [Candidatus Eisenbacteria bacterium]
MVTIGSALAGPETTGKWSSQWSWKGTPVHLVLMSVDSAEIAPGDTADIVRPLQFWRGAWRTSPVR